MVAETVVPPLHFFAMAMPNSRRDTFLVDASFAMNSICAFSSPTQHSPLITAIVAGTTPCCLQIDSDSKANSTLSGWGIPCAIIVDSNAKTGIPATREDSTSAEKRIFINNSKYSLG